MSSPNGEWDDMTPIRGINVPDLESVPFEVAMIKMTLQQLQQMRREDLREHAVSRKAMRNIWIALTSMAVTLLITASAALVQMGSYMERVDSTAQAVDRIEQVLVRSGNGNR